MGRAMDDLDHRLIALLRENARLPVASLSAALGVSRATVKSRIDRMVSDGTIQGFTLRLRAETERDGIRAVMMIAVEGRVAEAVMRALQGYPEIRRLHSTNGRWDIVAELETPTLSAFDASLSRIRLIDGIASTETSILLSSRKG